MPKITNKIVNSEPLGKSNIEQDEEGWWFWDEVWFDRYGPYATKEECRKELSRYIAEVLGHN